MNTTQTWKYLVRKPKSAYKMVIASLFTRFLHRHNIMAQSRSRSTAR